MTKRFFAGLLASLLLLTSALRAHDPFAGIKAAGLFRGYRTVLQIDPVLFVPSLWIPPYLLPVALVNRRASVYGLNTGIATPMARKIYGLSCPLLFCKADTMKGISLSGKNTFNRCQGLSVAVWQTIDEINSPALTVALWQECHLENKGVQLGLVNTVSADSYHREAPFADLIPAGIYGKIAKDTLHYVQSSVVTIPGNTAQIGIFNSANDGLQIGILNRNPNSWLPYSPLLNFSRPRKSISQRMTVSGLDLATWTTFSYTISGLDSPSQSVSDVTYEAIPDRRFGDVAGTEHFSKHQLGQPQPIHLIQSITEYDQHGDMTRITRVSHHELKLFSNIIKRTSKADRDIVLDSYHKLIAWHDHPDKLRALLDDRSAFFWMRDYQQSMMAKIAAEGGNEPAYVTLAWQTLFSEFVYDCPDTFRNIHLLLNEQGITTPDMLAQHPELLDKLFNDPDDMSLANTTDAILDLFFVRCRFSPNQQDAFGRTPLMRLMQHAARRKHSPLDWQRVLERFNSYGVNWSLADAEGKRYLDYAVAMQVKDMDAVLPRLLNYNNTTLSAANTPGHRLLAYARNIDNIQSLVNQGLDLNAKDAQGRTLLHIRPVMVKELVGLGMDINAKDNEGNTPLVHLLKYVNATGTMLDNEGKSISPADAGNYIKVFTDLQSHP